MIDQISRLITEEEGLQVIRFIAFQDNEVELAQWCFSQLTSKAHNLKTLVISQLMGRKENKEMFLDVALDFIRASGCLRDLTISLTNTEAEPGR